MFLCGERKAKLSRSRGRVIAYSVSASPQVFHKVPLFNKLITGGLFGVGERVRAGTCGGVQSGRVSALPDSVRSIDQGEMFLAGVNLLPYWLEAVLFDVRISITALVMLTLVEN